MQQQPYISNTDCHYFLSSTCTKGTSCPYRHCEKAKSASSICTVWSGGRDCQVDCPYRHPDRRFGGYTVGGPRSARPCHFFKLGNCAKGAACEFSHDQPGVAPVASSLHAQAALQKQQEAAGGGAAVKTKPAVPVSQEVNKASVDILKKHSVTQRAQAATPSGEAAPVKQQQKHAQSLFPKNLIHRPPAEVNPPPVTSGGASWQVKTGTTVIPTSAPASTSRPLVVNNANVPNNTAPARPMTNTISATATGPAIIPKPSKVTKSDKMDFEVLSFEEIIARKKGMNASSPPPAKTNGVPAQVPMKPTTPAVATKPTAAMNKRPAPGSTPQSTNKAVTNPTAAVKPVEPQAPSNAVRAGPSPAKKPKVEPAPQPSPPPAPAPAPAPVPARAPAPSTTATSSPSVKTKVVPAVATKPAVVPAKPVPKKQVYDDDDDDDDDDDGDMADYFALLEK